MTDTVDVLIITALLIEYEAARDALSLGVDGMRVSQWLEHEDLTTPYLSGRLEGPEGAVLRVALARPIRMGAASTLPMATTLVERLEPRCIAMTGVCAGNPSDVALGDVIISELAYAYDEGKRTGEGFEGDHRQIPAPPLYVRVAQELTTEGLPSFGLASSEDADLWLLQRLYQNADPAKHPARGRYFPKGAWRDTVLRLMKEKVLAREANTLKITEIGRDRVDEALVLDIDAPNQLPFKIFCGPIASGSVVVKDGTTWEALKIWAVRSALGLEMEAAAIAQLAYSRGIEWVVVKGVMDHADANKADRYNLSPHAPPQRSCFGFSPEFCRHMTPNKASKT